MVLLMEDCDLLNSQISLTGILSRREGLPMLTTETLIAVICFGLTCFALGYTLGKDSTQKRR